jgi:hypothetical protein
VGRAKVLKMAFFRYMLKVEQEDPLVGRVWDAKVDRNLLR